MEVDTWERLLRELRGPLIETPLAQRIDALREKDREIEQGMINGAEKDLAYIEQLEAERDRLKAELAAVKECREDEDGREYLK